MHSHYNISQNRGGGSLFGNIDIVALMLYFALVSVGIVCIISASYDPALGGPFSMGHNYMKQIMWGGIALVMGLVVLLLERRYFHMFA